MVGMEDPSLLHQQQALRTGVEGGAPAKGIHEARVAGPEWNRNAHEISLTGVLLAEKLQSLYWLRQRLTSRKGNLGKDRRRYWGTLPIWDNYRAGTGEY